MEEIASRLKSSSIDSDSTVYSEENTGIEIKVRFDTIFCSHTLRMLPLILQISENDYNLFSIPPFQHRNRMDISPVTRDNNEGTNYRPKFLATAVDESRSFKDITHRLPPLTIRT